MDNDSNANLQTPLIDKDSEAIKTIKFDGSSKDEELASAFKKLEIAIEAKAFPRIYDTPFPPRRIGLLSDKRSYMLLCTHEKVCYISEDNPQNPQIVDISSVTKREIRHLAVVNDEEIVIAETATNLYRVNLREAKVLFTVDDLDNYQKIMVRNNTLYVVDSWYFRAYNLEDNSLSLIHI